MPATETETFLTAEEIAEKLRVPVSTVREWSREGVIPSVRISHKVIRYEWAEVVKAIQQHRRQSRN